MIRSYHSNPEGGIFHEEHDGGRTAAGGAGIVDSRCLDGNSLLCSRIHAAHLRRSAGIGRLVRLGCSLWMAAGGHDAVGVYAVVAGDGDRRTRAGICAQKCHALQAGVATVGG